MLYKKMANYSSEKNANTCLVQMARFELKTKLVVCWNLWN